MTVSADIKDALRAARSFACDICDQEDGHRFPIEMQLARAATLLQQLNGALAEIRKAETATVQGEP